MAHECFEDAEAAAVMNALFVNVKVDREERPDVDAVYMDAVQAHDRPRRLADDRVPHARRPAVLRRHLLPEADSSCSCSPRSTTCGATGRADVAAERRRR